MVYKNKKNSISKILKQFLESFRSVNLFGYSSSYKAKRSINRAPMIYTFPESYSGERKKRSLTHSREIEFEREFERQCTNRTKLRERINFLSCTSFFLFILIFTHGKNENESIIYVCLVINAHLNPCRLPVEFYLQEYFL